MHAAPISSALRRLADERRVDVPIGELADVAGHDSTAALLALFAAASLVPGIAPAFGIAICYLAAALLVGARTVPLPASLRRRRLRHDRFVRLINRVIRPLEWVESRSQPRLRRLTTGAGLRAVGLACLIAGVLIVLPIPFGNLWPAIAILCLSIGVVAGDGVIVVAGQMLFLLALAIDVGIVVLSWEAIRVVVADFF